MNLGSGAHGLPRKALPIGVHAEFGQAAGGIEHGCEAPGELVCFLEEHGLVRECVRGEQAAEVADDGLEERREGLFWLAGRLGGCDLREKKRHEITLCVGDMVSESEDSDVRVSLRRWRCGWWRVRVRTRRRGP